LVVALIIIGSFFYVYWQRPDDDTLKGALIAAFAGAWGYFLGSSSGSKKNAERADVANDNASKALDVVAQALPPAEGARDGLGQNQAPVGGSDPGVVGATLDTLASAADAVNAAVGGNQPAAPSVGRSDQEAPWAREG
jgi:hypothetical protein